MSNSATSLIDIDTFVCNDKVEAHPLQNLGMVFSNKFKGETNMPGQIRMTPEQMRARSGEVRGQSETFQGVIERMQSIINELQTEWEGAASRAFAQQFDSLKPSFNSMKELLDDIATQLSQTADAVEQLDQQIAGQMGAR